MGDDHQRPLKVGRLEPFDMQELGDMEESLVPGWSSSVPAAVSAMGAVPGLGQQPQPTRTAEEQLASLSLLVQQLAPAHVSTLSAVQATSAVAAAAQAS